MEKELATWEDKERLMQQFPAAPAWSQAISQDPGEGGVSAPEDGAKPEELKHVRRPNPKVSGPEWAV
jgi:hypothetical protein